MTTVPTPASPEKGTDAAQPTHNGMPAVSGVLCDALQHSGIRYCLLPIITGTNNIAIAVEGSDLIALPAAVAQLREQGAPVVVWRETATGSEIFVARDAAYHRVRLLHGRTHSPQSALIRSLLATRKLEAQAWMASAAAEIDFHLAAASIFPDDPWHRAALHAILNHSHTADAVERLSGRRPASPLTIEALQRHYSPLIRRRLVSSSRQAAALRLQELRRRWRAWLRPQGLVLVALGPDGAGKTTTMTHLTAALREVFPPAATWHWRAGVIFPMSARGSRRPHSLPPRNAVISSFYLLMVLMDYWLGYFLQVRPALVQGRMAVLDRYFPDILVDPLRYRYGGPRWLPRVLHRLLPPLGYFTLIVEADEHLVASRKADLTLEEIRRQTGAYRQFAPPGCASAALVRNDSTVETCWRSAWECLNTYLADRVERQFDRRRNKRADNNIHTMEPAPNPLSRNIQ